MEKMPEFLTVEDVAKILRISKVSAYRFIEECTIPHYRIRRTVRIDKKDLLAYIEKSRVESRDKW